MQNGIKKEKLALVYCPQAFYRKMKEQKII